MDTEIVVKYALKKKNSCSKIALILWNTFCSRRHIIIITMRYTMKKYANALHTSQSFQYFYYRSPYILSVSKIVWMPVVSGASVIISSVRLPRLYNVVRDSRAVRTRPNVEYPCARPVRRAINKARHTRPRATTTPTRLFRFAPKRKTLRR